MEIERQFLENSVLALTVLTVPALDCDAAGENNYWDGENPLNAGLVTVDPSAPAVGVNVIYLLTVTR